METFFEGEMMCGLFVNRATESGSPADELKLGFQIYVCISIDIAFLRHHKKSYSRWQFESALLVYTFSYFLFIVYAKYVKLFLTKWILAIATLPVTKGQDPAVKIVSRNATTSIAVCLRVVPCLFRLNNPPALYAVVEYVSTATPIRTVFAPLSPVVCLFHATPRKAVQVRFVAAAAVKVEAIPIVALFVHLVPEPVATVPAFVQLYL